MDHYTVLHFGLSRLHSGGHSRHLDKKLKVNLNCWDLFTKTKVLLNLKTNMNVMFYSPKIVQKVSLVGFL
jgi:hypothetical protein